MIAPQEPAPPAAPAAFAVPVDLTAPACATPGRKSRAAVAATDLDGYADRALRAVARTERVGPFTVYVNPDPHGHFSIARPTPGQAWFTPGDVRRAILRQHELGEPGTIGWVCETVPWLAAAITRAGLHQDRYLLVRAGPDPAAVVTAHRPPLPAGAVLVATAGVATDPTRA